MSTEPTSSPVDSLTTDQQTDDTDRDFFPSPAPLDCGDLAETFRIDQAAAIHLLMTLTPTQRNLQALAYAAYLNERHALDLDMDDILTSWQRGLGFDTR